MPRMAQDSRGKPLAQPRFPCHGTFPQRTIDGFHANLGKASADCFRGGAKDEPSSPEKVIIMTCYASRLSRDPGEV
jgi:hypothetical protein